MEHPHLHPKTERSKKSLWIAISATTSILLIELIGSIWTNSLALFSDSAHVFMDLFSFVLSLGAIYLAERPMTDTRTFGWHRAEVFAALINGITVFIVALVILIGAVHRIFKPQQVLEYPMLWIALIGLLVNLFVIWKLHPYLSDDLNVRSAFLHAFGDAAASVAVVISGLLMIWTKNPIFDPIAATLVAVIIFYGAFRICKEATHILLEGVPKGMQRSEVVQTIESLSGPHSVQDLHIWNICSHLCALSVHIVLAEKNLNNQKNLLQQINALLMNKYKINHATIQIELESWNAHAKE